MKHLQPEYLVRKHLASWLNASRWFVGFSGGMDSTVLLHILSIWKQQQPSLPTIQAIYVHHGLQDVAEFWPAHCQVICDQLDIPLTIIPVQVSDEASMEQAARKARYDAYQSMMSESDILLTAQHQRDQAETVLFRLVRGTGIRGLMGIPVHRALSHGYVIRPLLDCHYDYLQRYAREHQLTWIEDPSNQQVDIARNYIRHQVLPVFQKHWPQTTANIAQAANHAKEAQQLLDEIAQEDLKHIQAAPLYDWLPLPSMWFTSVCQLSQGRQKNALSYWLTQHTLLPSTVHWQGWFNMLYAGQDATPVWKLHSGSLHRSFDRLWWVPAIWEEYSLSSVHVAQASLTLPDNGSVNIHTQLPLTGCYIRYRKGGESIQLLNRGTRDLKRLFNEAHVPLFLRARIPLLFDETDTLIAVANFPAWVASSYQEQLVFKWQPALV